MIHGLSVTVVIPTKNEAKGIAETIQKIPKGVDRILVIDGNSSDQTREIATKLGCDVINEPRKGYGRAYLTAFDQIKTDLVATCDGDGTYPIEILPELIEGMQKRRLDFLNASRFPLLDLTSMHAKNFWGNAALTFIFNTLFQTTMTDVLSGMWVFKSSAISKMKCESENWDFSEEIKFRAVFCGLAFGEVAVPYRERIGETKMSPWKTGIENFIYMLKLRLRHGSLKPQVSELRRHLQRTQ